MEDHLRRRIPRPSGWGNDYPVTLTIKTEGLDFFAFLIGRALAQ
jgi:hypothetical protein